MSTGNITPTGVYSLTYKTKNAVLRGPGYASPVSYWMPFNGDIGMHDATWRSAFGKTIYKYDGSHGCVNVPYECAEAIFNNIEVGTPVIAYYREPVTLTSNSAKISNAYSFVDPEKEKQTP